MRVSLKYNLEDLPSNAIDMMEHRLLREIDRADSPFDRHLAALLLSYYYSGEYRFWMHEGEIMIGDPEAQN